MENALIDLTNLNNEEKKEKGVEFTPAEIFQQPEMWRETLKIIKNQKEVEFKKIIKEFFFTLIPLSFIVNITGLFLGKMGTIIGSKQEIYFIYPVLISTVGDVGSIVGSTATTKLAFGTMEAKFSSLKEHIYEITGAWSASLLMYIIYAVISGVVYEISNFLGYISNLLLVNILSVFLIVVISFLVAIFTRRKGWDPDNFVIPLVSSLADTVTTLSLLLTVILF